MDEHVTCNKMPDCVRPLLSNRSCDGKISPSQAGVASGPPAAPKTTTAPTRAHEAGGSARDAVRRIASRGTALGAQRWRDHGDELVGWCGRRDGAGAVTTRAGRVASKVRIIISTTAEDMQRHTQTARGVGPTTGRPPVQPRLPLACHTSCWSREPCPATTITTAHQRQQDDGGQSTAQHN